MAMKDPYLILGISRRENFRGIREAYQELTKKYHPDRAGPDATDKFRAIQEAYENLSNPEKRTIYDHDLDQNEIIVQSRPEPITYASHASVEFRSPGPLSLLREFRSIYPSFEPLYERFVRNFTKKQIPKGRADRRTECRSASFARRIGSGWNDCRWGSGFLHLLPVLRHRSRLAVPLLKLRRSRHHRNGETGLCAYSAYVS